MNDNLLDRIYMAVGKRLGPEQIAGCLQALVELVGKIGQEREMGTPLHGKPYSTTAGIRTPPVELTVLAMG